MHVHTLTLFFRCFFPVSAATPAAAAATAAVRAAATPGDAAILLQHPLSSKYNVSASSDILAAASYATVAAVLIPGSTHMEVNVAATFTQNMSPVWALS